VEPEARERVNGSAVDMLKVVRHINESVVQLEGDTKAHVSTKF
jgi:hypothetical protein